MVIRYYSKSEKKFVTSFLNLEPVVKTTGKDLFEALKNCLEHSGLKITDCIGFASDGASAMVGEHDCVWPRMKAVLPNFILIKCICHSSALYIKNAFEKVPSNLGFMLSEIPRWFSKSILRREACKELFETFEGSVESSTLPLPFQKFSQTRWLVRGKEIFNILVTWEVPLLPLFVTRCIRVRESQ